jgi:general secretion pathway protein H
MPMSAPGSRRRRSSAGVAGFTLVELLLVVAIVAMAGAGVGFALRDLGQTVLEREAQRLIAMLESARARSRASGMPVLWRPTEKGFEFVGLPVDATDGGGGGSGAGQSFANAMPWLGKAVTVRGNTSLTLGPEPIIPRQEIVLQQSDAQLRIGTDGLRAFSVLGATVTESTP